MTRPIIMLLSLLATYAGPAQAQDNKATAPPPPPTGPLQGGWNNQLANS